MVKKNILLMGAASFLMLSAAKAETVNSGDWSLNISVAATGDKVCTATTIAGAATTDYQLAIKKSEVSPIQITVKALGQGDLAQTIASDLPESKALMSSAASQDGKLYWYVPNNSGELIKTIKAKWQLPFRSAGNPNEGVAFSLSGSSAILNYMEADCNQGLKLENDVLLNQLPNKKLVASTLTSSKVKSLKSKYLKTHQAIMALDQAEIDLVDLESEFATDLSKKDELVRLKNYLSGTLIPSLVAEQSDIKKALPQQKRKVAALDKKVPGLEAALSSARQKYQSLEQKLRPLLAQQSSLRSDISSYESSVSNLHRRIQSLKSDIASTRQSVKESRDRLGGLDKKIEHRKREKADISAKHRRALAEKQQFKPAQKIREQKQRHPELKSLKASVQQLRQKTQSLKKEVTQLTNQLKAAQKELAACKKKEGANCKPKKQKVDNLKAKQSAKKKELKSTQSKIKPKQAKIKSIEKDIENKVNRKYKEISDREKKLKGRLKEIDRSLQKLRGEKLSLRQGIEAGQGQVRDLQFRLDNRKIDMQSAKSGLASSRQNLSAFTKRHRIPAKKKGLAAAENRHSQAYLNLKNTQDAAQDLRAAISSGEARLISAKDQEVDARQELVQVKAQEAEVNRGLKDYNAKKKTLDAKLIQKQKSVKANVVAYRKTL